MNKLIQYEKIPYVCLYSLILFDLIADHIGYVDATDGAGKTSQARVHFILLDTNDSPPEFKKRSYQGFMNSDLTRLRNDLQVEVNYKFS